VRLDLARFVIEFELVALSGWLLAFAGAGGVGLRACLTAGLLKMLPHEIGELPLKFLRRRRSAKSGSGHNTSCSAGGKPAPRRQVRAPALITLVTEPQFCNMAAHGRTRKTRRPGPFRDRRAAFRRGQFARPSLRARRWRRAPSGTDLRRMAHRLGAETVPASLGSPAPGGALPAPVSVGSPAGALPDAWRRS